MQKAVEKYNILQAVQTAFRIFAAIGKCEFHLVDLLFLWPTRFSTDNKIYEWDSNDFIDISAL